MFIAVDLPSLNYALVFILSLDKNITRETNSIINKNKIRSALVFLSLKENNYFCKQNPTAQFVHVVIINIYFC